jgi:hypothetical protein
MGFEYQSCFWEWFESLSRRQQETLARLFWILTTNDLSDTALSSEALLRKFRAYVLGADLGIRSLVKMISIVSVMDFILQHIFTLLDVEGFLGLDRMANKKIITLETHLWQKTIASWSEFKRAYFSSQQVSAWLKSVK